jgi:hypothetical protein
MNVGKRGQRHSQCNLSARRRRFDSVRRRPIAEALA